MFLRKQQVELAPFPQEWRAILSQKVRYYRDLSSSEQERFARRVQLFLETVDVHGAGVEVDVVDKLLVAASAEIPLFGFKDWRYPNIDEVILSAGTFSADFNPDSPRKNVLGIVGDRHLSRAMVISKPALHDGFERHTQHNVGIHEFTHLIDMSDGAVDGPPAYDLPDGLVGPWMRVVEEEITTIREGTSEIDPYGGTNEAEFFAIVSEYFFNKPEQFAKDHPTLFGMLEQIFRQDPTKNNPVTESRNLM